LRSKELIKSRRNSRISATFSAAVICSNALGMEAPIIGTQIIKKYIENFYQEGILTDPRRNQNENRH